jgi:hypothetical protein
MSRVATPQTPRQPATTPIAHPSATQTPPIPHEKIAMRAYEKWCQRGRPQGTDLQDWIEAEAELRNEFNRSAATLTRR